MWQRSAWHIGLGLAGISYSLLLAEATKASDTSAWSLIGLTIPFTLTAIASNPQRQLASWLSILGLCLIQPLTFGSSIPRLIGLGIATLLMLLNTQQLQQLLAAVFSVGFGLAFSGAAIWQVFSQHSIELWINVLAIAPLILWLWQQNLSKRGIIAKIYAQATDGWAISIACLNLLVLTGYDLWLYSTSHKGGWQLLLAATVITIAIGYRTLAQPSNVGFYGIGWGCLLYTSPSPRDS